MVHHALFRNSLASNGIVPLIGAKIRCQRLRCLSDLSLLLFLRFGCLSNFPLVPLLRFGCLSNFPLVPLLRFGASTDTCLLKCNTHRCQCEHQ